MGFVGKLLKWAGDDGPAGVMPYRSPSAMKHPFVRFTALSGLLVSLLSGPTLADTSQTPADEFQPLTITKQVGVIYPAPLSREGIRKGEVAVICSIDETGQMTDYMPLAYTHEGFYDAALVALKQWEFEPAQSRGRAHPAVQIFTFEFEAGRDVVDINGNDNLALFINRFSMSGDNYRVLKLSELDAIPTPVELVKPLYPETYVGSEIEGEVVIEFYIDENGDVRLPAIIEHNGIDFAATAVEAVRQWKFEPPMRNGKPVTAVAMQQFHFNPSEEKD